MQLIPTWAKRETLSPKQPEQKRVGGVAQVIVCLPSKHEALISSLSSAKKKIKQNSSLPSTTTTIIKTKSSLNPIAKLI
jgi:hypothetical protein